MTIANVAKTVGWTLLNATTSGLAGGVAGCLAKGVKNMVNKTNFSDDILINLIPSIFIGLVASALPPASGHFGARTIMAAIGGTYAGLKPKKPNLQT